VLGTVDMSDAMDVELRDRLDRRVAEPEALIEQTITTDGGLATTARVLRLAPEVSPIGRHDADRRNAGTG